MWIEWLLVGLASILVIINNVNAGQERSLGSKGTIIQLCFFYLIYLKLLNY